MNILVVVDMQNDFITGVFGSKEAQKIVPKVINFVKQFKGSIKCTLDTHFENEKTIEGITLPKHCIEGTEGRKYPKELLDILKQKKAIGISKDTFMPIEIFQGLVSSIMDDYGDIDEMHTLYVCGLVTDICVLNTALYLRNKFPYDKVIVLSDLCAGTTAENHQKALDILKNNLIEIQNSNEV